MRNRGPTPAALLAQLAEDVTRQIQAGSHVRFDAALDELTAYHRFLLEAYATVADDGQSESYARMRVSWSSPHQEWLSVYFDIIDVALKRLRDDSHFISTLSYLPVRLMPRGGEYGSSQPGDDILNLEAILTYRLEAWRRATPEQENEKAGLPESVGRTAYDDILMSVVSAWENTLQYAPALRDYENIADPGARWRQFTQGSSFLLRHLQISGEMLLTAVWNHDFQGEARFRDVLLRWPSTTGLHAYDPFLTEWQPGPNTDLFARDWPSALRQATSTTPGDTAPEAIFGAVLENTHAHLATIVAALMLNWCLTGKADFHAVQAAQRLLSRQLLEGNDVRIGRPQFQQDFRHVFFRLLEMHLSGRRGESENHGVLLDGMTATLDRLSERRVQSGRGYTPSTVHDRSQLSIAFVLILTASASAAVVEPVLRQLKAYLSDEPSLPDGDHTVLDVVRFLDSLDQGLHPLDDKRGAILRTLNPQIDLRAAINSVRTIAGGAREFITALRNQRIRARAIDPKKIRHLEALVDGALSTGRGDIAVFRSVAIRKLDDEAIALDAFQFGNIPKNEFVTPPMDYESSNFFDFVSKEISENIANRIWRAMQDFERTGVVIEHTITDVAFWERVEQLAGRVGPKPCLTISSDDFTAFAERFLYRREQESPLRVARNRDRFATPQDRYVVTVNGIDVHALHGQDRQAWLFSAEALAELHYRILGNGLIVTASFVTNGEDPWKGRLDCAFGQRPLWRNRTLFELSFARDPAAADDSSGPL